MDKNELRDYWMNLLQKEGFRPEVDDDGDIVFKFEGGWYYIFPGEDDMYFHLIYPNFWPIESEEERARALLAANEATRETKVAKVFLAGNGENVWATAELFCGDPSAVEPVLNRCLRAIGAAVHMFREKMRSDN
ncbi:hypothetical protein Arub01_22720 [Actinomadura rubrobrunea]|uniref:YbjN domain-containing protein n=1 Tax=Actinomadura rubrobrunea TaxID=115335 RepID=A0A9W6PW65_9ACTN|nr:hypothetical protein Arub01_22720 [Actinomadura rubrobrunea]